MEKNEIVRLAKKNLVEGENWHKKVNVREIVFGFNDGSISTLALLAGVTGGALARARAPNTNRWLFWRYCRSDFHGYRGLYLL